MQESKTDYKEYKSTVDQLQEDLIAVRDKACDTESLTQTMVEFIHKFEPVYVQRQITQALQYVLPDATIQWRLKWFNEVKMPVLTTMLLQNSSISLEENMQKFKDMIKLDSITQDELYIKNAMKSQQMHQKAIEIIQDAMFKIMNSENQDVVRSVNTDIFLQRLN